MELSLIDSSIFFLHRGYYYILVNIRFIQNNCERIQSVPNANKSILANKEDIYNFNTIALVL